MSSAVKFSFPETASSIEAALIAVQSATNGFGFRDRVVALADLSTAILRDSKLRGELPSEGVAYLASFLQADNLIQQVKREIGRVDVLDGFVRIEARKSLRLVPRGLACHWVAGNVPFLAVLSWAMSAAVGNRNFLRLSSEQIDVLRPLLSRLAMMSPAGREIAKQTAVVSFDRTLRTAHEAMSRAADIRIAWGGREAVDAIRELPARWHCEDVVFGPRVSLAVVEPDAMTVAAIRRLAVDVAMFDQLACTSPQIVFVRGLPGESRFDSFVRRFAEEFGTQSLAYPRHRLDHTETYRIALDRARTLLVNGRLICDAGTEWSVAVMERPDGSIQCANRFLQIVPWTQMEEIYPHIPENVQTVTTSLNDGDFAEFTNRAAQLGVCRFPTPGEGSLYENPWDGIGIVSRLTRAVLRTERGSDR